MKYLQMFSRSGAFIAFLTAFATGLQSCTAAADNDQSAAIRKAHAWADAAFAKPKAQRRDVNADRRLLVPFSFKYEGKSSDAVLDQWKFSTRAASKDNLTLRTNSYTDPKSGLVIECEIKTYRDFAAVDWVCRLTNRGKTNTPIVENFMPLDSGTLFRDKVAEGAVTLRWCNGDRYRSDGQGDAGSFLTHDEKLVTNRPRHFDSLATFTNLPFFNIQVPRGGWILAVGWTGFWQAEFAHNSRGDVSVRAGMQKTRFCLKPGESVRTPSVVLMRWTGDDMSAGHNEFRRLVFAHYCQKLDGKVALPPIAFNSCAVPYVRQKPNEPLGMLNETGELAVIDYIANLGCDTYWMDAYWYPQPWHLNIGNWFCRPEDFPRGLRPLADAAHAKGMKFVLWMLPPSVAQNTRWAREHPEFIHGGGDGRGGIWKMGEPKAREWITDWVVNQLNEWQVDIYREDGSWLPSEDEGDDRVGIVEMKHVDGLYKFWDGITSKSHAKLMDNCEGGGNRIDIETSRRGYYLWRSDFNDLGEGLKGEKHWPRMALADQVTGGGLNLYGMIQTGPVWSTTPYSFRSGMSLGVALYGDIQRESFPREQARQAIAELKTLRHLFLGDIYRLLNLTTNQNDWFAYQLNRPDLGEGCAFFFRRPDSDAQNCDVQLRAIDPKANYVVSLTGETYEYGPWKQMKGREFIRPTITIREKPGSVLLLYRKVARE